MSSCVFGRSCDAHVTVVCEVCHDIEMLRGFMALYNYQGPLAPGLSFVKTSLTCFYSLFISSSALHLIAERLASVTADTIFIVFGSTRLRMEPSLPASKANALNHYHGIRN